MKKIFNFSEYVLNEISKPKISAALTQEEKDSVEWPEDWKLSDKWKALEKLGFEDITSSRKRGKDTIIIINDAVPIYFGGLVLQKTGYIRSELTTSGWIKNKMLSLYDMFDYLISRYTKRIETLNKLPKFGISIRNLCVLDNLVTNEELSRLVYRRNNNITTVNVPGSVNVVPAVNRFIPEFIKEVKFGNIEKDFLADMKNHKIIFSVLPTSIGGDLFLLGDIENIESIKEIPYDISGKVNICGEIRIPKGFWNTGGILEYIAENMENLHEVELLIEYIGDSIIPEINSNPGKYVKILSPIWDKVSDKIDTSKLNKIFLDRMDVSKDLSDLGF